MSSQRSLTVVNAELVETQIQRLKQFRDAARTGDLTAAFQLDRANNSEELMGQPSKLLVAKLHTDLRTMALNPFLCDVSRLPSFRPMDLNTTRQPLTEIDTNQMNPSTKRQKTDQPTYKVYYRQFTYPTVVALRQDLEVYKGRFPGDTVWAEVCLKELVSLHDEQMTFLHYGGMTTRSAAIRGLEDGRTEYRRWSNWLEITSIPEYATFQYDTKEKATSLQVRDRDDLQDLERCLIAVCSPSINSSRGGIRHSLAFHPLAPTRPNARILGRKKEPWPFGSVIDKYMNDSRRYYATLPAMYGSMPATPIAYAGIVRHAQRGSTYLGVMPTLAIGSDITHESMRAEIGEMGYSDRYTGPGPRATDQARLNALGLHHQSPGDTKISLNSFVDFFALTTNHDLLWLPILNLIRLINFVKPVIIRPCSSRLSNLFLQDYFLDILAPITSNNRRLSEDFFNGVSPAEWRLLQGLVNPSMLDLKWNQSQAYQWCSVVGEVTVVPVGNVWVLCIPDFDGGILKYDPRMTEVIADIKKVIALKGVLAEEIVMTDIEEAGNPNGDYSRLTHLRRSINLESGKRGLSAALAALKIRYKELHRTIHARRCESRWPRQIAYEIESGIHDEEAAARSHRARQIVIRTVQGHIKAQGAPGSTTRQRQFDSASTLWSSLVSRGLEETALRRPPRYYDHTDTTWVTWWMNAPEGHDMSASSYAYNGNVTRHMSNDEKKVYARRLLGGKPANFNVQAWRSNTLNRSKVVVRLASTKYFLTSERNHDSRLATCTECGGFAIGDLNIKHRCLKGGDERDKDALSKIAPTAQNLQYVSLVWPHDLIEHPVHGYETWTESQQWINELSSGLSEYLDDLGLQAIEASTIIRNNWDQVKSFVTQLDDLQLGKVYCLKEGADSKHLLAMAIDKFISARALLHPPVGGHAPPDTPWDDSQTYGMNVGLSQIKKAMTGGTSPLITIDCSARPSYGFTAVRLVGGKADHCCPSIYGPLLKRCKKTYNDYKATHGEKAFKNHGTIRKQKLRTFWDLRVDIQRRFWQALTRPKDAHHKDLSTEIMTWKAK